MTALPALADLRRAVSRHRVLLAAGLAAASVATGLSAVAPTPPDTSTVLVAARDLRGGAAVTAAAVRTVRLPLALVPDGAVPDLRGVAGRLLAGPVRAGEPLTDVRLLGAGLLPPGALVAVPVRVAEPATAALVRSGDTVDVLSAPPDGAPAVTVAAGVGVLSVPLGDDDPAEGALLVVAADRQQARALASAAVSGRLSVVVHGR